MARESGSKTATFSPAEIEALGLSQAEDFGAALREKIAGTGLTLDPDIAEMIGNRAHGVGVSSTVMVNAILRQSAVI